MKGLVIGGALVVVALLLLGRGWTLQRQERERAKRLVPVRARVIDQGSQPLISIFTQSEGTQREDINYEGHYGYVVAGTGYTGKITSAAPVFRSDQMPPAEITVFYDSADPTVSSINKSGDSNWGGYVLFGVVVFVVAVGIVVVANLPSLALLRTR